ncbi:winged helix-turn-helix transcriptional regulator [Enterococcus sp. DIV0187]|jgi:Transcriptional regulators of sugar metabolism|uniref:winged helix-turn-helix domain-containing protein n=1 Tax=Enterococcus sp. DIV0187 TaxID=2774644 RepID=UPI003F26EF14
MNEDSLKKIGFDEFDVGMQVMAEFKRVSKNQEIIKGMEHTVKVIGRPRKITKQQLLKAYGLWEKGKLTQKEVARELGVSIRTINRNFKKLESEDNSIHRK